MVHLRHRHAVDRVAALAALAEVAAFRRTTTRILRRAVVGVAARVVTVYVDSRSSDSSSQISDSFDTSRPG